MYGGQVLEVNATGVLFTAQAAGRQMARFGRGGSIILIASVSGSITNRVSRERKIASVTDNGAGSRVCAVQHVQVCDAADPLMCAGIPVQFQNASLPFADYPRPVQSGDVIVAP